MWARGMRGGGRTARTVPAQAVQTRLRLMASFFTAPLYCHAAGQQPLSAKGKRGQGSLLIWDRTSWSNGTFRTCRTSSVR
eukprot:SAG11_NODE_15815_length_565_cov_1.630901_2_plen_79_part_01